MNAIRTVPCDRQQTRRCVQGSQCEVALNPGNTQRPFLLMVMVQTCALMFVVTVIAGCATARSYTGPTKPRSEVGVLNFKSRSPGSAYWVVIHTIDGVAHPQLSSLQKVFTTVELLPGQRTLDVECVYMMGMSHGQNMGGATYIGQSYEAYWYPQNSRQTVIFTVGAGHSYKLRYNFRSFLVQDRLKSIEVTDTTTGDVVFSRPIMLPEDGKPGS